MSKFEQRVKHAARLYWQGISPDPAFTERLIHIVESDAKQRVQPQRKVWSRIAVAGLVASLFVAVSLPGVRAAATNVIQQVFHIGSVEYVVNSGTDPAPTGERPKLYDLDPKPDSYNRWFYVKHGQLPAEVDAALEAMSEAGPVTGDKFRLPAWLPEDSPKRLQLPPESTEYDWPRYYLEVLSNGEWIVVKAMQMANFEIDGGTTQIDAERVTLGGIEGLEVQEGGDLTYYLVVDNVTYRVSGPTTEIEVIRKIAESFSVQDR